MEPRCARGRALARALARSRESMILQLLTACSTIVLPPAPLIIVGPGCQSTQLLTAKLAAAAGHRVQCVTRTADVRAANRLMYGTAEPPEFPPLFSCQNSQIASALGAAEGMILCVAGGKAPPSTSGIGTMMPYMPRVRRIVLLSAIGGSTGNTGGLGEGELILRCEEEAAATAANPNTPPSPLTLRKTSASPPTPSSQSAPQPQPQTQVRAAAAGVEVSTVRVGVLKGGAAAGEQTTGLDEAAFYASLCAGGYPTPSQQCAKLYDRQTLGVSVRAGDAIEARNAAQRSSTRTSAERARARPRTHATAADDATRPSIEACVPAPQRAPTTSRASSRRARCSRRCATRRRSRSRSRRRRAARHRRRASGTRCFCGYERAVLEKEREHSLNSLSISPFRAGA